MKKLLFALLISFSPLTSFADTPGINTSAVTCGKVFNIGTASKSVQYYLDKVDQVFPGKEVEPRFIDPVAERALQKKWRGTTEAPRMVQDTFQVFEGRQAETALVNIQLMANDAGTVKIASPGNFTTRRLRHTYKGEDYSTNIGLSIEAILASSIHGSKFLVPETSKAVILAEHGGGTKTTGHQVFANLSNFMGKHAVPVLAYDGAHHGYGARMKKLTPREQMEYVIELRWMLIPPNVPVFYGGHSRGGLMADIMMRFSDDPVLGPKIKEAFAGAISLSTPLDSAPGRPLAEKRAAEEKIADNKELMDLVPESERDLTFTLFKQGKFSGTGGMASELMMAKDWALPKHGGKDYLPTLFVTGEVDALNVGRLDIIRDYVEALSNTEVHIMGERTDFHGNPIKVAHMIFDHYRPGTKDHEAFHIIKEFVETRLGEKLPEKPHSLVAEFDGSTIGLITNLLIEYDTNLAFRIFANEYTYLIKKGTEKMAEMGKQTGMLSKELKFVRNELKQLGKQEGADPAEIARREVRIIEIEAEMSALRDRQRSVYIPEGLLKKFAQENVTRREQINQEMEYLKGEKGRFQKILDELRSERDRLVSQQEAIIESLLYREDHTHPAIAEASRAYLDHMIEMADFLVETNTKTGEHTLANYSKGISEVNPLPEHMAAWETLNNYYSRFNELERAFRHEIEAAIGRGEIHPEARDGFLELYGSVDSFLKGEASPSSIMGRLEARKADVAAVDQKVSELTQENYQLTADYINKVTPDLYEVKITTLREEMNQALVTPEGQLPKTGEIQRLWKTWKEIWGERPPEEGTSLY